MNDIHSLSHSKWNCKYHIVFAPKYRRKVFYAEKRQEIGEILRQLCKWYGANLIEGEVCPDNMHMLVEIPNLCLLLEKIIIHEDEYGLRLEIRMKAPFL